MELVIAGARGSTNVGGSLFAGAQSQGIPATILDTNDALKGPWLLAKLKWHLLDHRPVRLEAFGRDVIEACRQHRPRTFLCVGFGHVEARTLRALRGLGITTINFLTDDPWNPAHRAEWALRATREYDCVISPRRANMADLVTHGCRAVRYLPFGYDPAHCYPDAPDPALASDVIFVGGADADRVPWMQALLAQGIRLALYGSYWERFEVTRGRHRGQATPETIRRATASAKVALCLVRRANRDGHVMRSLEIAATGACMLAEDTAEHRELFGADDECVVYFSSPDELVEKLKPLLQDEPRRTRLAQALLRRIGGGHHTYAARVAQILAIARELRGEAEPPSEALTR
jgi:spore maturation protein CgeB